MSDFRCTAWCETTSYTSVIAKGGDRFTVVYDRLAGGWAGPPGAFGTEDHVFAMDIHVETGGEVVGDDLSLPFAESGLKTSGRQQHRYRPRPPYRAWGFPSCSPGLPQSHACLLLEDFDASFRGTNLFLTANGNAVNESAALNAQGAAPFSRFRPPEAVFGAQEILTAVNPIHIYSL